MTLQKKYVSDPVRFFYLLERVTAPDLMLGIERFQLLQELKEVYQSACRHQPSQCDKFRKLIQSAGLWNGSWEVS
ncbi:hypothetical protein V6R21_05825 [Limibacter armeniacum]|uniref:hypothetical protein n=1 Tax=Limibacter armeniacum TaxID=466084 RepID=UPI002FE54DD9